MRLTRSQLDQLIAQARRDAPNETCGLIGGQNGRALRIYPLRNAAPNPRIHYLAHPEDLVAAVLDIEDAHGWQVVGIYHSHPASPAYPSPTDVRDASDPELKEPLYPDAVYILISLRDPAFAEVRGFTIRDEKISEVTLEIEEK